jgi:hypothetical protein
MRQTGHIGRAFYRILRADQPPDLIQSKFGTGLQTHMNMTGMRRVK